MKTLTYQTYLDKVYGCFLGKCVGGTAGGPAEGRKELLDFPLDEAILHTALPNDDLDLQILWLEVLEDKGLFFTREDLAKAFYENTPYGPGEYAYFMKNYARGILPPTSGSFNNRFYENGMGCPIRAEIWACICPGDPEKAKPYVFMDGEMDHRADSVWAEYFVAVAEANAFFADSVTAIPGLLTDALSCLPPDAKITQALTDTIDQWRSGRSWRYIRSRIIRRFGHPDCTNLYQNMCFTLLSLLFGGGDMRETIRLGCAMGYDTDCICATAASLVGIIRGADYLMKEDGFTDTGIKATVRLRRPDCSIQKLAEDVAIVGMTVCDTLPGDTVITDRPAFTPIPTAVPDENAATFSIDYMGDPVLTPDAPKTVTLTLRANRPLRGILSVTVPANITCDAPADLDGAGEIRVPMSFGIAPYCNTLGQSNLIRVIFREENGIESTYTFGLNGADIWYCYGPFFHNNYDLSHIRPTDPYGKYIPVPAGTPWEDPVRDYHLNRFADITADGLGTDEAAFFSGAAEAGILPRDAEDARLCPERIALTEDYFESAALYTSEGPAVSYLYRLIESPEARPVDVTVGCEGPFRLWINGIYIGGGDDTAAWTLENKHFYNVPFKAGRNEILFKLCNQTGRAAFSLIYRIPGKAWQQYHDFTSVIVE